jgi:hypothetical protein
MVEAPRTSEFNACHEVLRVSVQTHVSQLDVSAIQATEATGYPLGVDSAAGTSTLYYI